MTDGPSGGPDLRHVDTWIFDLDNTLYPPECELLGLVGERMTAFVARWTGLPHDQAYALQKRYLDQHGTTLAGLMAEHGVDPRVFLDEVHAVPLDAVRADPGLREGLERLPGRRLVFTNADEPHATRVLDHLNIADLFEGVFTLELADWTPKPQNACFAAMMQAHAVDASAACFFEDTERNLAPARRLGMTTVLVGPHAADSAADFVDHRTEKLPPFLMAAIVRTAP